MSTEFKTALDNFLISVNAMIAVHTAEHFKCLEADIVSAEEGLKYIRIVKEDGEGGSRHSYCFIDKSNGDVLKCEGWKKPAKGARGNIFSASNGLEGVGVYGANYLK